MQQSRRFLTTSSGGVIIPAWDRVMHLGGVRMITARGPNGRNDDEIPVSGQEDAKGSRNGTTRFPESGSGFNAARRHRPDPRIDPSGSIRRGARNNRPLGESGRRHHDLSHPGADGRESLRDRAGRFPRRKTERRGGECSSRSGGNRRGDHLHGQLLGLQSRPKRDPHGNGLARRLPSEGLPDDED